MMEMSWEKTKNRIVNNGKRKIKHKQENQIEKRNKTEFDADTNSHSRIKEERFIREIANTDTLNS